MNNFFVSFVFIFVSCIYINMILFNYIKEYLDSNNETLESCIRGLETKINDSDSILKEVEKKMCNKISNFMTTNSSVKLSSSSLATLNNSPTNV